MGDQWSQDTNATEAIATAAAAAVVAATAVTAGVMTHVGTKQQIALVTLDDDFVLMLAILSSMISDDCVVKFASVCLTGACLAASPDVGTSTAAAVKDCC